MHVPNRLLLPALALHVPHTACIQTYPISFVPPSMAEMYALHGVALLAIGASIIGSSMVIFSTIYRSRYGTIGERFPLYVSIIDFLWSISHSVDHILMIVNKGDSPSHGLCVGLGATLALFLMAQVMLLNIIAVSMFLTVYRGWSLSYGKGDWVLWVLTFGVPLAYTIVGLAFGAFGPDLYWCYLNPSTTAGWVMWSVTFIAAIACIALPAFCYYMIYWKITDTQRRLHSANDSSDPNSNSHGTANKSGNHSRPSGGAYPVATMPPNTFGPAPGSSSSAGGGPTPSNAIQPYRYPPSSPSNKDFSHSTASTSFPAANFPHNASFHDPNRPYPPVVAKPLPPAPGPLHHQPWEGAKNLETDLVARKNRRIVEKLLQYELVLIITFSSLIVYGASIVAKSEPTWMVFLVVVCFNSAGWLNAAVYFYQDWKKRIATRDREFDGPTRSKW
ncbi:hypothetical protein HDU96_009033 [Phlyctochytrium bullatum]|nr:hypothetical protein HDU96_009033 [Phlyctochytrium bullatum]